MYTVSVGMCAYNEERNIAKALDSVSCQKLDGFELLEMLVVSSASTDRTDEVALDRAVNDGRIRLIRQEERRGKSDAVNLFMDEARGEILVLVNADNILEAGALQNLLLPFNDPRVGMTGGRPVPVNDPSSFVGFSVNMLWDLHHRISMIEPKTGELVAFRDLDIRIPLGVNTDEDYICSMILGKGYSVAYAPEARARNKGPENLRDLLGQRARVNIGEGYMRRKFDHHVPTWDTGLLLPLYGQFLKENRRYLGKALLASMIEATVRLYASIYVRLDKGDPYIWRMIDSSKELD
jgi:biofilm PGA synthesis N-glycosyltransferase PgaC